MSPKRVLVVDDALELGRLIRAALATLDPSIDVMIMPSAEEALLEASRLPVDLLIADLRLPGLSGQELTSRMSQRIQGLKVIQITGQSEFGMEEQARAAGVAFFRKPLPMNQFLDQVAEYLGLPPKAPLAMSGSLNGEGAPSGGREGVANLLSGLRQALGAEGSLLLDGAGHVIARAGDLPDDDFESQVVPAVMGALSAALKVDRALGAEAHACVLTFKGQKLDLAAAPVGADYALLVLLKSASHPVRLAVAYDEMLVAIKALQKVLAKARPELSEEAARNQAAPLAEMEAAAASAPAPASGEEELPGETESLAALLGQDAAQRPQPAEADAFWETLSATDEVNRPIRPDVLTYEQARKLGLAPQEEDAPLDADEAPPARGGVPA